MRLALFILTLIDLGIGFLLVAVSGYIFQGVNNEATMNAGTVFFGSMIAACFLAPAGAWWLRSRGFGDGKALAILALPVIAAIVVMMAEP